MSARTSIGGTLSYQALAMLHRPTDPAKLAAEIMRMHGEQRLSAQDISVALRMDYDQVINIVSQPTIE